MGVPAPELSRVVSECSGDSFALRLFQQRAPADLATGVRRYLSKDLTTIHEVAGSLGLDLGRLGELAGWVDED